MPSYTYKQQQALREADGIQAPWTHTASSGLGVHISNVLTWHTQADATAAEASKTLGVFRRDLSECPKDVKKATVWCPPRRLRRTDRKHTALERQSFNSRVRLSCLGPVIKRRHCQVGKGPKTSRSLCSQQPHDRTPDCVSKMVSDLGWEPLREK